MEQKIFDMLIEEEEVTWKTIIYNLVESEEMDPWDVSVTTLTKKYIQVIKEMQEHDLRVSGKILLAAALLLKIKSRHLLERDISKLDMLLNEPEEEVDEEFFDDLIGEVEGRQKEGTPHLIPRNPQPRRRKVALNDLIDALQRAINTKKRVLEKQRPKKFVVPKKGINIVEALRDIYHKVTYYAKKKDKLEFSHLLPPQPKREDKVYTFIPLLVLENQRKITTTQDEHFSPIYINLNKKIK